MGQRGSLARHFAGGQWEVWSLKCILVLFSMRHSKVYSAGKFQ